MLIKLNLITSGHKKTPNAIAEVTGKQGALRPTQLTNVNQDTIDNQLELHRYCKEKCINLSDIEKLLKRYKCLIGRQQNHVQIWGKFFYLEYGIQNISK